MEQQYKAELDILEGRMLSFKERLKVLVEKSNSIRNFARVTAISEATIRQYLNGKSEPKMKHLISIAQAGNVSIEWLSTGMTTASNNETETQKSTVSAVTEKWLDILNTVTEQDKETALKNIINNGFKTLLVDIESDQHISQPKSAKQTVIDLLSELDETEIKGILNILYPEIEDIKKTQKRA